MSEGLVSQSNHIATKKKMDATTLRQEAIASNIGNVQTPGYKRIDVANDFKDAFAKALNGGGTEALKQLAPGIEVDSDATERDETGNTVDLEKEILHLSENQIAHHLEVKIVTGTLSKLRLAITGRPS